jgi:hypothetical protein
MPVGTPGGKRPSCCHLVLSASAVAGEAGIPDSTLTS